MSTTDSHSVIGGPTKLELTLALIDHLIPTRTVAIHINCPHHSIITIEVTGLDAFDKAAEEWDITGVVYNASHGRSVRKKSFLPDIGQIVIVHYNTNSHSGKIHFFDKTVPRPLFCSHMRTFINNVSDQYEFNLRGRELL